MKSFAASARAGAHLLVVLVAFFLTQPLFGQDLNSSVDSVVERARSEWSVPGMAVAIVKDDAVILLRGYGLRAAGKTDAVTPNTLFGIGSTTKAFTSAAVAILVDDKKLGWNDSPRRHLPYFRLSDRCADSEVTIRDILTHRTGLARHDELWDYTDWSREQVIRAFGELPLDKPFRSEYQYQNITFIAAGEIVASASGTSWEEFVKKRLLEPMGMTQTRLSILEARKSPDHAVGHRRDAATGQLQAFPWDPDVTIGPGGSIHSSARDMSRWIRMHLANGFLSGKQIVSPSSLNETRTPHTAVRVSDTTRELYPETRVMSYGMGWTVQDHGGEMIVTHLGALNGFRANVTLLPQRNAGFVILSNTGPYAPVHATRNAIIDLLMERETKDWVAYYSAAQKKAESDEEQEKNKRQAGRHMGTRPGRELPLYAGSYRAPGYGTATISFEGDRLVIAWGRLRVPLQHFHFETFSIRAQREELDELVTFILGDDGEVEALRLFGQKFLRQKATHPVESGPGLRNVRPPAD